MDFITHINIYVFPMILLAIIFFSMHKNPIHTMENNLFQQLLATTFLLLFVDLLSWIFLESFVSFSYTYLYVINTIFFALIPLVAILWLNYLSFYLTKTTILHFQRWKRFIALIPLMIYYTLLIINPITGWIFTINTQNEYVRGQFYFYPYALNLFYIIISICICITVIHKEVLTTKKKKAVYFMLLTLFVILGSLLQIKFYGIWLSLPFTATAEMLLYIDTQNEQITIDSLTSLNNRGCFDTYLKDVVTQPRAGYDLYLFMMDLNHFKQINDTFGHAVGDQALVHASKILRKTLAHTDGFLARYGGDEFAFIRYCENDRVADEFVQKIETAFSKEASTTKVPYTLSISIGYAYLDKDWGTPIKTLIEMADAVMYQKKKGGRQV